jgi:flavodoxin
MAQHILVAFYSMTGNTRQLASEIAAAIDADLEEIREPHARSGVKGVLRALCDALLRRKPAIEPIARDPADYDLLVLGGPVWSGRIAAPVRTYADIHGKRARQVALFCTQGCHGAEEALSELEWFFHPAPRAALIVDAEHLPPTAHRDALRTFVCHLQRSARTAAIPSQR